MRAPKLIWQLFPINIVILMGAMFAVSWFGTHSLRIFYVNQMVASLEAQAHLVKPQAMRLLTEGGDDSSAAYCVQTEAELATRFGLHPNMITNWKRQAINNMSNAFDSKSEKNNSLNDSQLKDLHAKIGQLTIERDFLAKAFGR